MAKFITETCSGMPDETSKNTSGLLSCPVDLIKFSNVVRSPKATIQVSFFLHTLSGIPVRHGCSEVPDRYTG